jgi:hypothetical protein
MLAATETRGERGCATFFEHYSIVLEGGIGILLGVVL